MIWNTSTLAETTIREERDELHTAVTQKSSFWFYTNEAFKLSTLLERSGKVIDSIVPSFPGIPPSFLTVQVNTRWLISVTEIKVILTFPRAMLPFCGTLPRGLTAPSWQSPALSPQELPCVAPPQPSAPPHPPADLSHMRRSWTYCVCFYGAFDT